MVRVYISARGFIGKADVKEFFEKLGWSNPDLLKETSGAFVVMEPTEYAAIKDEEEYRESFTVELH